MGVKVLDPTGVSKPRYSGLHTFCVVVGVCGTVVVEPTGNRERERERERGGGGGGGGGMGHAEQ